MADRGVIGAVRLPEWDHRARWLGRCSGPISEREALEDEEKKALESLVGREFDGLGTSRLYYSPVIQSAMVMEAASASAPHEFNAAEIGAVAHLYRGEVYRSTMWRTRLDNTTNWAVVALGIAVSVTFSSPEASPLPLVLVGILMIVFLVFEARRYRYFNVWRARARWLETHFYAPMLRGEGVSGSGGWPQILANDYCEPRHHISLPCAIGRRLRRNYIWILGIQALAYYGKIAIHPLPIASLADLFQRAAVGPIRGEWMLVGSLVFNGGWILFALVTLYFDRITRAPGSPRVAMG